MASPLTASTKLEAVNEMLSAIGEAPVASLASSGLIDVSEAVAELDRTLRAVLGEGWHFNTDKKYTLTPNGSNRIVKPSDALQIDPSYAYQNYTVRNDGGTLSVWDLDNHTFEFTNSVKFDIVRAFEFEQTPQLMRQYVTMLAARRFAKKHLGDPDQVQFTDEDVARSRAELEKWEEDHADHNMNNDPDMYSTTRLYRTRPGYY